MGRVRALLLACCFAPLVPDTAAATHGAAVAANVPAQDFARVQAFGRLDGLRAAGLERWRRERATSYLDTISAPARRDAVRRACADEASAEEQWMCEKRGARLAEYLASYDTLTSADYDRMEAAYAKSTYGDKKGPLNAAMRVKISRGRLGAHTIVESGAYPRGVQNVYHEAVLEKMRDGIDLYQTTTSDTNVDIFFLAGDGQLRHDEAPSNPTSPADGAVPSVPVNAYCRSRHNTPPHIALPYQESRSFQVFPGEPPNVSFEQLKDAAVYRGSYYKEFRGQLSIIAGLELVPGLDVGVFPIKNHLEHAHCVEYARGLVRDHLLESSADPEMACRKALSLKPMPFNAMLHYRYVLSIDGHAAVLRFPHAMKGPGVVITMTDQWEEYFFEDVIPYVHFVPVTTERTEMLHNVSHTMAWLRENQGVAKDIAKESTRWVKLHKTIHTDHLYYKLFYALLNCIIQQPAEAETISEKVQVFAEQRLGQQSSNAYSQSVAALVLAATSVFALWRLNAVRVGSRRPVERTC